MKDIILTIITILLALPVIVLVWALLFQYLKQTFKSE